MLYTVWPTGCISVLEKKNYFHTDLDHAISSLLRMKLACETINNVIP